jgi:hypothetical protein
MVFNRLTMSVAFWSDLHFPASHIAVHVNSRVFSAIDLRLRRFRTAATHRRRHNQVESVCCHCTPPLQIDCSSSCWRAEALMYAATRSLGRSPKTLAAGPKGEFMSARRCRITLLACGRVSVILTVGCKTADRLLAISLLARRLLVLLLLLRLVRTVVANIIIVLLAVVGS